MTDDTDAVRTRTRTRDRAATDETTDAGDDRDTSSNGETSSDASASDDETTGGASRRRRRGGRGRGRRGGRGRGSSSGAAATDEASGDRAGGDDDDEAAGDGGVEDAIAKGGTRLAAKRQQREQRERGGGRAKRARRTRGRPTGMPDEMRRAILEGPPRTMLVTTSGDRTQIAVLEDRTVVEHYVTRKADVSYVGNVYLARVQNVLPGMEAAFLDIGKGRNGVLYAGEVAYDELDLEEGAEHRIETALKPGQTVLVQVTKDPMGTKGARLTMQLSLAGRYMVLAPNDGIFGISRKLSDDERDRLRRILKKLKPEGVGVIVRTAAAEATEEQLEEDLERLVRKWDAVRSRVESAKALDPVYEEPDLVVRVIRDHFGPDFEALIVDDPEVHEKVRAYLEEVMPESLPKLDLYERTVAAPEEGAEPEQRDPLFTAYHVTDQLRKALERKVWLPSGGYLIIERTEAMTVIDVNTGKFTGSTNLEETVLKTNLEAAAEIVRQLRLRDIGGMIVIDFIDMLLKTNQDQVVRTLKRELLRDRTKTRVSEVSKLGLVQMTRKNVSQGLVEAFSEKCSHCEGRGVTFTLEG